MLSEDHATAIAQRAPTEWFPSVVVDERGRVRRTDHRTSMQHSLTDAATIETLTEAASRALGFSVTFSEGTFVRYTVGQYFRMHGDVADMDDAERSARHFTLVYCICAATRGGLTAFPRKRAHFDLRARDGLLWSNLLQNGAEDEAMDHEARPVVEGEKIIINAWFRRER